MSMQVIMRPVYNRPEMLYLSIESEIKARNYYEFPDDLITIFVIEYGADPMTEEIIKRYPAKNYCLFRREKLGLTTNILEGFKDVFDITSDYVLYIEDDVCLHETFFKYLYVALNKPESSKASVISSYNKDDLGGVSELYKGYHYAALGTTIFKRFYLDYVYPFSLPAYYNDMYGYVAWLDSKYKGNKMYKYQKLAHVEQAGMINRAVDINHIQEEGYAIMPRVNRSQHIGVYGKNRVLGKSIPGNTFDDRVDNLREIIKDADKMYDMAGSKEYNDYKVLSPKLENWDGKLKFV